MPSQDLLKFNELKAEITALVAPTKQLLVKDFQTCSNAVEAGKSVKDLIKKVEAARKDLVGPLNDEVKEINAYAKQISEPLLASEEHLKHQIVTFEIEQQKIRQAELKRLEEERIKKLAEIEAQAQEQNEVSSLFGSEPTSIEEIAQAITVAEAQHQEAAWDIANNRVKNTRKTWKCEVLDISKVPKEFLIVTLNEAAVLASARAGVKEISGVKMWQETGIAFGSKTYVPRTAISKG